MIKIKLLIAGILSLLIIQSGFTQHNKVYTIQKTERSPAIDGRLDEAVWNKAAAADSFLQIEPYNGEPSTDETQVKMLYDNEALYIGGILGAANHTISRKLTERDNEHLADYLFVLIDPFNDGLNGFGFKVTTKNVQIDVKYTNGHQDKNWDAVWKSATSVLPGKDKWVVEMRIPYSELRFPAKNIQSWGLNIIRNIEDKREQVSWNYVDINKDGLVNQSGVVKGIQGIEPPARLSFMPYISTYINKQANSNTTGYSIKGGTDLKYGINQSFTLDMMLIPDFGQVQEDDEVLNLSPFETYYDEKRQFFIEGREMFNRAGIFYSRRIGGQPRNYHDVNDQLRTHEKIKKNPKEAQLINATKITGKTPGGFGLGVLNAMTLATHAKVEDTLTNETRQILTQGFANYNVTSIEQSLKNNSYASFINTNKSIPSQNYMANTSGSDISLKNATNNYGIEASGAVSQIYLQNSKNEYGYYYDIEAGKISGNFQFDIGRRVESYTYDPNAMGYLQNNNEIIHQGSLGYSITDPFSKFLNLHSSIYMQHAQLQNPKKFKQLYFNWVTRATTKNHLFMRYRLEVVPVERNNYNEARSGNRVFIEPAYVSTEFRFSSDYRNTLAFDGFAGYYKADSYNQQYVWFGLAPRLQPSSRLTFVFNHRHSIKYNNIGFVKKTSSEDSIIFGKRKIPIIENTLNADFILNEHSSFNLRIRHYWSQVAYNAFYLLKNNGRLKPFTDYNGNEDFSMNAVNMQVQYNWNFAPGSSLSVVWKNQLYNQDDRTYNNYFSNIESVWQTPADNSISLKLLYYIHYEDIKNLGNKI